MKNKIIELLQSSLAKLEISGVDIYVETPKNNDNGDFSSNIAMQLTRVLKKNPRVIAEEIISNIPEDESIEKIESRLSNENYVNKAPEAVVAKDRQQVEDDKKKLAELMK